jgi:hypothetical protein
VPPSLGNTIDDDAPQATADRHTAQLQPTQ